MALRPMIDAPRIPRVYSTVIGPLQNIKNNFRVIERVTVTRAYFRDVTSERAELSPEEAKTDARLRSGMGTPAVIKAATSAVGASNLHTEPGTERRVGHARPSGEYRR
jgi:hypothetical protein